MVNDFTALLNAGDADSRALLGESATFAHRGTVYGSASVIMAPAESEVVYAAGGAELRVKATATLRKDALVHNIAEGDSLTLGSQRFFITAISSTPHDPLYHLTLAN